MQQWQDSYTELEQKLESLEGSKQSDVSHFELEQLQTQLASKNYELSQARQSSERDVEAMQQWEGKTIHFSVSFIAPPARAPQLIIKPLQPFYREMHGARIKPRGFTFTAR